MKKRLRAMRIGFLMLLGGWLSACAADGAWRIATLTPPHYPPPGYAHRAASSHVVLYWNCANPVPGMLRLEGLAFNPWSPEEIRYLEFELVGVDNRDRAVSAVKTQAADFQLRTFQSTPFQLDLQPTGTEVRFDLYSQYRFHEGDGDRLIAGPAVGRGSLVAQELFRFLARDACSETQHLAR